MTPSAVVFLGPTMPVAEASRLVDARFLPPVRQGDLYRAVRQLRPAVIGIIDGHFHQSPSVWHREILWAMTEGIHVFGAASMGALRAAELQIFGMRGVGKIFEAYRDGAYAPYGDAFEDDDEVAIIHGPAETGFLPLSEAMVDIRDSLVRAAEAGVIDAVMRDGLVALGKAMPYRERGLSRIIEKATAGRMWPELESLSAWLTRNHASRKQRDAAEMLHEIRLLLADFPGPFKAPFRFEPASVWIHFIKREGEIADDLSELETAALTELRLDPREWREIYREALLRRAAIDEAAAAGILPSDDEVRISLDALRRSLGLLKRQDLESWAAENALDGRGLARLMREEATLDLLAARSSDDLAANAADLLRLKGRFAALAARSLAKRRWAAATGVGGGRPSGMAASELIDWFVSERLGQRLDPRPDADGLAALLGFRDLDAFLEALLIERLYSSRAERDEKSSEKIVP